MSQRNSGYERMDLDRYITPRWCFEQLYGVDRGQKHSSGQYAFAQINSCTIRVDSANKRGIGWLMEVAWPGGMRRRWVARGPIGLSLARSLRWGQPHTQGGKGGSYAFLTSTKGQQGTHRG